MERKRLNMLDTLKSSGGIFTDSRKVEMFLKGNKLDEKSRAEEIEDGDTVCQRK